MKSVFLGSQLWVEKGQSAEELRADVRGMQAQGLRLARIFLTYDAARRNGTWDYEIWDELFTICDQEKMQLSVTLSAFAQTGRWAFGEEPSAEQWEQNREDILEYVRRTVERYRDRPSLDSWILQNEPHLFLPLNGVTVQQFRDYLSRAYAPEAFRARYGLESPQNLGWISPDGSRARIPGVREAGWSYAPRVDWARFNRELLLQRLCEVREEVRKGDRAHPTTVNADALAAANPAEEGRDVFALGKAVDFLGCSAHVSWHSTRFPVNRIHQSVAMFADMTRSATADRDGCFWVTELQAGTNFFSGVRPMCPSKADLAHWIWESISTGARGVVFWLYRAREQGFEALEWGLMNQRGGPSERSEATREIGAFLQRHREAFAAMRPKAYDGLILRSTDSCVLSRAESNDGNPRSADLQLPRNDQMVQDASCGAYLLLQDMGLDVGFVSEETLDRIDATVPFVVAPNAYALQPEVLQRLLDYVQQGGTLVVDGLFGAKNAMGDKSGADAEAALQALFGEPMEDFAVENGAITMRTQQGDSLPAWFLLAQWRAQAAEALARDEKGRVCAVRHACGKGCAIHIGTLFFQNYFRCGGEIAAYRKWMEALLPAQDPLYRLENPSALLRRKVLHLEKEDWVAVLNRSQEAAQAHLRSQADWIGVESGKAYPSIQGRVTVELAPEEVAWFRAARR